MTELQLNYLGYLETKRSNLARETETNRNNVATLNEQIRANLAREQENLRSHLATERENIRSHMATEAETRRSNLAREFETNRHNLKSESNEKSRINEIIRSNKRNEELTNDRNVEIARHNYEQETIDRTKSSASIGSAIGSILRGTSGAAKAAGTTAAAFTIGDAFGKKFRANGTASGAGTPTAGGRLAGAAATVGAIQLITNMPSVVRNAKANNEKVTELYNRYKAGEVSGANYRSAIGEGIVSNMSAFLGINKPMTMPVPHKTARNSAPIKKGVSK